MKSCCVISWDDRKNIYGLRLKRRGDKRFVDRHFCDIAETTDTFPVRLEKAWNELKASDCDQIVLTGHVPGAICFELSMPDLPKQEMLEALQFEMSRHLPYAQEDIVRHSRVLQCRKNNGTCPVRVFATKRHNWNLLLEEINNANIKFDAFIYPFMAIDPLLENQDVYLPAIDNNFYFTAPQDGQLRQMKAACDNFEFSLPKEIKQKYSANEFTGIFTDDFIPAVLISEYLFDRNLKRNERQVAPPLPHSMKPQRFKLFKILTPVTAAASIIGLSLIGIENWQEAYGRYNKVNEEIIDIQSQIEHLKGQNIQRSKAEKDIKKLFSSVPQKSSLLDVLCFLAEKLPHDMWVTNYRGSNNEVDVTIKASKAPGDILNSFNKSPLFSVENLRQRRNYDGSYYVYLRLNVKDN